MRNDILEQARKLRPIIEKAAESLTDADASVASTLFPALKQSGELIKAGTRINWQGKVMRAAVDLWDRDDNDPDHAPALWEDISYREGIRIIPDVITAGTAFAAGELGWWGDLLYRSVIPANVYTPAQYPAGWEAVE